MSKSPRLDPLGRGLGSLLEQIRLYIPQHLPTVQVLRISIDTKENRRKMLSLSRANY